MGEVQYIKTIKRVPIEQIYPNDWNPRKQDERGLIDKAIKSIRLHGFCGAVVVRDRPQGKRSVLRYQILDGEHRYLALKEMGADICPVINLGTVTDYEAKLITLNFNLIQGEMLVVDLASVMSDLEQVWGRDKVEDQIAATKAEVQELMALAQIDWSKYENADISTRIVNSIRRVFAFVPDAYEIVRSGLDRMKEEAGLETDEQAIAEIARRFNAEHEEVTSEQTEDSTAANDRGANSGADGAGPQGHSSEA